MQQAVAAPDDAGLRVYLGAVERVERRADSTFARIYCAPLAQVYGARHVMLLEPLANDLPPRPAPEPATQKRGGHK